MEAGKVYKVIDAIKKERPGYDQVLNLFGKIVIKQFEFLGQTKIKPVLIAKDDVLKKLKKGISLLDRKDFEIDISGASRLFKELCGILKSEDGKLAGEIRKIEDFLEKDDLILKEIFQSSLTNEHRVYELAEQFLLDRDIMLLLAVASLKPSLWATASHLKNLLKNVSWSGYCCPVCGSQQAISELRGLKQINVEEISTSEGTERILYCSFCESEWQASRLGCTFCGNTDVESLQYLYAEGEKGYRLDVCDKCKRYIKTMDTREISYEIVPILEDIATLHFDIIAEEKGYKRDAWFIPVISDQ